MRRGWTVAGLGLVGLLIAAGCGEENAPQAPPWPDEDGSLPEDAGVEDADVPDADDGADSGLLDPDGGAVSQCEGDVLEYPAANAPGRPFSAAIRGNTVHLAYLVAAGGGTLGSSKAQGLRMVSFDTAGEAGEPEDVVNVGVDSYWKTRDPALVARGDALDLFFTSNSAGPFELFHQDLAGGGSAERETSNTGRNEFGTVASAFGGGVAAVYSDETAQLDAPAAVAFKRPGALPEELVPESVGLRATRLAFAEVGDGAGAVAFVSDLAGAQGIYFQGVSGAGAAQGELVTLSEQVGSASSAAVARGREGSAVVYTEAPGGNVHQLRFRRVDERGQVSDSVRSLTSANQDLLEIALAAYSQGYVVAYRRLGGPGSATASIYLLVIDAEGNIGGARLVRTVTPSGRGLEVMVGNDGRFVVIWSDTEMVTNPDTQRSETELRVRAARLLCAG